MWILWLILIAPSIPGEHQTGSYPSYDDCATERERMTGEFMKSYPGDTDYTFECRFIDRGI